MVVFCLLIILILIILIITIFASGSNSYNNFLSKNKRKKEKYGPPPGRQPAVNFYTMGYRGWPSAPYEFSGVTASALINYVEPWPEYEYQQSW